jgi:simple sugar transport system permease protein
MLVPAAASMLSKYVFGSKGVAAVAGLQSGRPFAGAASIPVVGALFGQRSSDYLAFGVAIMVALVLARTPLGTRAKAAGMNRDALTMAGIDSGGVRGAVYALSGLACGISGAALASSVGAWVPNMSAGRGWIALVAVYLGGKRLGGTFAASALFALLLSLATRAQAITEAPAELLLSLPYFLTAVVVVLGSSRSKRK